MDMVNAIQPPLVRVGAIQTNDPTLNKTIEFRLDIDNSMYQVRWKCDIQNIHCEFYHIDIPEPFLGGYLCK